MSKRPPAKQPAAKPSSVADVAGAPVGTSPLTTDAPELEVRVNLIHPSEHQARRMSGLDDEQIQELAASMRLHGQLQAIAVTGPSDVDGSYSIVFGHRRWLAAKHLGWPTIRARVLKGENDDDLRDLTIIENAQRADLSPVEECVAVTDALDAIARRIGTVRWAELPSDTRNSIITNAAQRLGKTPTWVRDRAYLARCAPKVQQMVQDGRLPLTHAREIAKVVEHEQQEEVAFAVCAEVDKAGTIIEPASKLYDVKDLVGRRVFSLPQAPWKLDVEVGGKPACTTCPHNSANQPGLFEHGGMVSADPHAAKSNYGRKDVKPDADAKGEAGVCLQHSCYMAKTQTVRALMANAAKKATDALEEVPKKDREKSLPAVAKQHAPAIVKPAAFKDRVHERFERVANRSTTSSPAQRSQPEREQVDFGVMQSARDAWYSRREKFQKDFDAALAKAFASRPGLFCAVLAFVQSRPFRALESTNAKSLATAMKSPKLAALVQAMKDVTADASLRKIEAECPTQHDLLNLLSQDYDWFQPVQFTTLAQACGFEFEPLPNQQAFVDAEYKRLLAAKNAPKPPAKPGKGKKAAAGTTTVKTIDDMRRDVAAATSQQSDTDNEEDLDS